MYSSQEKQTKKLIFITNNEGIQPVLRILNNKKLVQLFFKENEVINRDNGYRISVGSLRKMCSLSCRDIEELIVLRSIMAKTNVSQEDVNDFVDSFEINYNRSRKPFIVDTNDLQEEEQEEALLNNKQRNDLNDNEQIDIPNNECIEDAALKHLHLRSIISRNYDAMLIIWEVLYSLVILSGVNIFVHLLLFMMALQLFNSFYIFYSGVLACILLWVGISCLYCFIVDTPKEVYEGYVTMALVTSGVLSMGVWLVIPTLSPIERDYCQMETWYVLLYSFGVAVEVSALIMNFSMENFYRERIILAPSRALTNIIDA